MYIVSRSKNVDNIYIFLLKISLLYAVLGTNLFRNTSVNQINYHIGHNYYKSISEIDLSMLTPPRGET